MEKNIYLSLCIPTNGVVEWVLPVLDSIYVEKESLESFEVIITDNGNNAQFEKKIQEYIARYENLIYKKTIAIQFLNQIEAFKLAKGKLIKFINHRMPLETGALDYLIKYAKKYETVKPITYFANGTLNLSAQCTYSSFDEYVRALSYHSSWSAGTAMWREDFQQMNLSQEFNSLFPHTNMIFAVRDKENYIIDNTFLLRTIETDETKKGTYDLFHAFAVEYPAILLDLYRKSDISRETLRVVLDENAGFLADLYVNFCMRKHPCSYDLGGYNNAITVFYSHFKILKKAIPILIKKIFYKLKIFK